MLDLAFIRENAEAIKTAARQKGEPAPIDEIVTLDREWRATQTRAQELKAEQNQLSKQFGQSRDNSLRDRLKEMADQSRALSAAADDLKRKLDDLLLYVPNVFDPSVPIGTTEDDNVVIRHWGEKPQFDFQPKSHYELGEALGIMDFERAARVAGARFAFLIGMGARLERALVQLMLDTHTQDHGYTELYAPFLVNSASMTGTANLPKFGDGAFRLAGQDLWLIPTAEVPVTNFHREELLTAADLPRRYVAYSPCWRSEAGAAGKDTRGYVRMHQFSKVELVHLSTPEESAQALEDLREHAESILQRLGLHYRVKLMCSADMGFAQYKKYDLEAWCPGLGRYLEVSSCSLFGDFQARRAMLRYRPGPSEPPRFVHTLNGSALALARTLDSVLETYQREDGTIVVPAAVQPYLGGQDLIS
jgi:seryl-tRNA synthetase